MARTPSVRPATAIAGVPSRVSSAVGTLRVPSLSLRRLTSDALELSRGVVGLDVEEREPPAAGGIALGARERERHLRGGRGGEPLGAVEAPGAVGVPHRATVSVRPTSEPPVRSVIHWPEVHMLRRVAAEEVRERAVRSACVPVQRERARGAVGHRERAGVDVRRRVEEVHLRELVDPREGAVLALVGRRDEAVLRGERGGALPERR
jgi:hypothetical protein